MSRLWGLCGLPAILALFLVSLSAGGWSDHIRPGDQNAASLAGLIPHADALSYYSDTFRLAMWGAWGGERWRPLAEAFRQITVLAGGYSYTGTLLVQSVCWRSRCSWRHAAWRDGMGCGPPSGLSVSSRFWRDRFSPPR